MNNRKWTNIILGYSIIYTITTLLNSVYIWLMVFMKTQVVTGMN